MTLEFTLLLKIYLDLLYFVNRSLLVWDDAFRTDLPLHVPLQEQLLCQDKPMLLNRKEMFSYV